MVSVEKQMAGNHSDTAKQHRIDDPNWARRPVGDVFSVTTGDEQCSDQLIAVRELDRGLLTMQKARYVNAIDDRLYGL